MKMLHQQKICYIILCKQVSFKIKGETLTPLYFFYSPAKILRKNSTLIPVRNKGGNTHGRYKFCTGRDFFTSS